VTAMGMGFTRSSHQCRMQSDAHLPMHYKDFWSSDDRIGVRIPKAQISFILDQAQYQFPNETGGIIVGAYTAALDCALVESFTAEPSDSRSKRSWFRRGTKGLSSILGRAWKRKKYYIGEWHVHPGGQPFPSSTDKAQMRQVIASNKYDCDCPILVIIGFTSYGDWSIGVFAFATNGNFKTLEPIQ